MEDNMDKKPMADEMPDAESMSSETAKPADSMMTPPAQPEQPKMVMEEKKSNAPMLIAVLVIVAIVAIAGALFMISQNNSSSSNNTDDNGSQTTRQETNDDENNTVEDQADSESTDTNEDENSNTTSDSNVSMTPPFDNWKTYESADYGFAYPSDWVLDDTSGTITLVPSEIGDLYYTVIVIGTEPEGDTSSSISSAINSKNCQVIEEFSQEALGQVSAEALAGLTVSTNYETFGGKPSCYLEVSVTSDTEGSVSATINYVELNGKIFSAGIVVLGDGAPASNQAAADVLSTIKFK